MFFIVDTGKLFSQLGSMLSLDPGLIILTQTGYKDDLLIGIFALAIVLFNDWRVVSGSGAHVEALATNQTMRRLILTFLLTAIILLGNFNVKGFIYFAF